MNGSCVRKRSDPMDIDHKFALVIAGNFFGDDESAEPDVAFSLLPSEFRNKCEVVNWSC